MYNTFFDERMVFGNHRRFCQGLSYRKHYQSYKTGSHTKIKQVQLYLFREHAGKYHLIEIEPVTKNDQNCHKRNRGIVSF